MTEGADDFIETERKYDAAAGFALPDLAGLDDVAAVTGPRTYRLRAVYFDTPDFSLAKAKITVDPRYGEAWTSAQCMGMLSLPGLTARTKSPVKWPKRVLISLNRSASTEKSAAFCVFSPD